MAIAFMASFTTSVRGAPLLYTLVDLGVLPGTGGSEAYSVNASGQVAGFSSR